MGCHRFLTAVALVGAICFAASVQKEFTPQQRRWWAFQKVAKPAVPAPKDQTWVRNDIDAFVLAKLEEKGLHPAPPADKITLIRRATLDLTGLLPTPEEVQAFVADTSPDAFAKVVDRLLASPHYGERWARHWLDLARYADSEGFKSDETRPNIWRYRDYVIDAFNHDKPYDRFIKEQIAGDELYPNDPAALIATGFNRHFPDESNARNLMQRRQEIAQRHHRHGLRHISRHDLRLRPLPRSQVRSHPAEGLLPPAGLLRQHAHRGQAGLDFRIRARRSASSEYAIWEEKTKDIRAEMAQAGRAVAARPCTRRLRQVPARDPGLPSPPRRQAHAHPVADVLQGQAAARTHHGRCRQEAEGRRQEALGRAGSGNSPSSTTSSRPDCPSRRAMIDNGKDAPADPRARGRRLRRL